ncbi:cytochrome c oxidase assembly protein [Sphingomonas sp. AR_OL41]|uniref:cytochrome c oxidase assembly protein n=1 Tax=Sphingomonas sp. AR_OL41 TaxID=3042729 RepID=UPI0024815B88|nr:cytochrome c oxidase assembly protein [Sphingomonas sp. AR_OL41]MDH7974196.1 cytochrome c oxidase assembly protein [Sphingomonas sp. AR_OL41]
MTISRPIDDQDAVSSSTRARDAGIGLAVVAASLILWWLCQFHAAALPFWAPFEFSFSWFFATVLAGWWYARGLARAGDERPAWWRAASFVLGVAAIYTVLQTRFEYLAEHMFFLNRAQHVVMHHLGPLLIALAWPWPTLLRGMPKSARRIVASRWVGRFLHVMRQPFIAAFFFVGLIAFWLVPSIHFRAMLDPTLYLAMNWSMVADGILFWSLVLDPRDKAAAGISFGLRAALAIGVMFPQILIGAIIAFSHADLYRFYAWCGRIYPSIGPLDDQNYGGLIIWIPPAMMSVVSLLLVLNALRLSEEITPSSGTGEGRVSASSWTGR